MEMHTRCHEYCGNNANFTKRSFNNKNNNKNKQQRCQVNAKNKFCFVVGRVTCHYQRWAMRKMLALNVALIISVSKKMPPHSKDYVQKFTGICMSLAVNIREINFLEHHLINLAQQFLPSPQGTYCVPSCNLVVISVGLLTCARQARNSQKTARASTYTLVFDLTTCRQYNIAALG